MKKRRQKIQYYLQFVPFTIHFFWVGIALLLVFLFLFSDIEQLKATETASFLPFLLLMSATIFTFLIVFILFLFLNTLGCWIYYLWLRKKKGIHVNYHFEPVRNKKYFKLQARLDKVRRPLLGTVKSRLLYDDYQLTDIFTFSKNRWEKSRLIRKGIEADVQLNLPDIKTYDLKGGFVYFQDMLQLFSFPVYEPERAQFFQSPKIVKVAPVEVAPQQTESADIRVENPLRIPGDYLNYKSYETGDDIRRIVWKIYAKSREFVVRVPEEFDRYASHIYFYASFYASESLVQKDSVYGREMLNYYKNVVWTVYSSLASKGVPVRYIDDQELHLEGTQDKDWLLQQTISNSVWQHSQALNDYFKTTSGSILCISSFVNPDDLEEMLSRCNRETVVYYVKLSKAFSHFLPLTWFSRIFFKPPSDRLKKLRGYWFLHPFRLQLLKRERVIETLLQQSLVNRGEL